MFVPINDRNMKTVSNNTCIRNFNCNWIIWQFFHFHPFSFYLHLIVFLILVMLLNEDQFQNNRKTLRSSEKWTVSTLYSFIIFSVYILLLSFPFCQISISNFKSLSWGFNCGFVLMVNNLETLYHKRIYISCARTA